MAGSSDQSKGKGKGKGKGKVSKNQVPYPEGVPRGSFSSQPDLGSMRSLPVLMPSFPGESYDTGGRTTGQFTSQLLGVGAPRGPGFGAGGYGGPGFGAGGYGGPGFAGYGGPGLGGPGFGRAGYGGAGYGGAGHSGAGFVGAGSGTGTGFGVPQAELRWQQFLGGTADGMMRPSLDAFGTETGVAMTTPQVQGTGNIVGPSSSGSRGSGTRGSNSHAQVAAELGEDNEDSGDNEDGGVTVAVRGQSRARVPPPNPDDREVLELFYDGSIENPTAVSTIATNLRNMLRGPYFTYGMWPEEDKAMCWNRFKHTYQWDSSIENAVYQWYERVATSRFAGSVNHAKQWWLKCEEDPTYSLKHGCWLHEDFRSAFIDYWKLDTTDKKSKQNYANRQKGKTVNYRGGSRSTNKHRIDLANEKKIAPEKVQFQDVLLKTRAKTHDDGTVEWPNPEDKANYDAYLEHCLREYGQDMGNWPPWDVRPWLQIAAAGRVKKNRVSGLASYGEPECIGFKARKHYRKFEIGSSSLDSLRAQYQKHQAESSAAWQSQQEEISSLKNVVKFLVGKLNMPVPDEVWRTQPQQQQQQQQQQFNNFPAAFFQQTRPTYTNLATGPVSGDPLFQPEAQSTNEEDEGAQEISAGGGANDTTGYGDMQFDEGT